MTTELTPGEALDAAIHNIHNHDELTRRVAELEAWRARQEAPAPTPQPAGDVRWLLRNGEVQEGVRTHSLPNRQPQKIDGNWLRYEVWQDPPLPTNPGPGGRRAEHFVRAEDLQWVEGDEVTLAYELRFPTFWNLAHPTVKAWAGHVQFPDTEIPHLMVLSYPDSSDGPKLVARVEEGLELKDVGSLQVQVDAPLVLTVSVLWTQGAHGVMHAQLYGTELAHYEGPTLSDVSFTYPKWGAYCGGGAGRQVDFRNVLFAPGLGREQELQNLLHPNA